MDLRARLALLFALLLSVAAWGAVAWLVTHTYPQEPRALFAFYGALFLAVAATAGVVLWMGIRVIARRPLAASAIAFVGHGMVLSALVLFGLWLQSLRLLSPLHVVLLAGLYLFFEVMLVVGRSSS